TNRGPPRTTARPGDLTLIRRPLSAGSWSGRKFPGDLPINGRMRLIRIDWIQDGMELARDIPSAAIGAAPLLRRGVRLSSSLANRLGSLGIRALWIEDDMGEGIIPAIPLPDHIRIATEE